MTWSWTSHGGAQEIGGSCGSLHIDDCHLLIDCGMRQHGVGQERMPDLTRITRPDVVLLSHAHIDHTGALPALLVRHPHLEVYATDPTRTLARRLLEDSVRIMAEDEQPLFGQDQVDYLMTRFRVVALNSPFEPCPDVQVTYLAAGHILGAAQMLIQTRYGTLLHANDFSVTDQRTVAGVKLPLTPPADILVTEGTYGARGHPARRQEERKLVAGTAQVLQRGGRVLFPAFGVGRSQEIALTLHAYASELPQVPIYLDGMVRQACDIYQQHSTYLHPALANQLRHQRKSLFADSGKQTSYVRASEREQKAADTRPAIIISSSGMLTGGPSVLYAQHILNEPQSAIAFSGYQDEDAPGAKLLRAERGERITLGAAQYSAQCTMHRYQLSAHADGPQIAGLATHSQAQMVLLVHGMPDALQELAAMIGRKAIVVQANSPVQLPQGKYRLSHVTILPEKPVDITEQGCHDAARTKQRLWTAYDIALEVGGLSQAAKLQPQVAEILASSEYFVRHKQGSGWAYEPRSAEQLASIRSLRNWAHSMAVGRLVVAKGNGNVHNEPFLSLVQVVGSAGTTLLNAARWKPDQPLHVVVVDTMINMPEKLQLADTTMWLKEWQESLDWHTCDLVRLWHASPPTASFDELCAYANAHSHDEKARLALAMSERGSMLWQHQAGQWHRRTNEYVVTQIGTLNHHLTLLAAARQRVWRKNGSAAILTGKSQWMRCEVRENNICNYLPSKQLLLYKPQLDSLLD